jgi:hypothetical protein
MILNRQSSPGEPAGVAAVIASDPKVRIFRDQRVHGLAAAARPEDCQRGADEPPTHRKHPRHRRHFVSGILRSAFEVRRQDVDAVRGSQVVEVPVF